MAEFFAKSLSIYGRLWGCSGGGGECWGRDVSLSAILHHRHPLTPAEACTTWWSDLLKKLWVKRYNLFGGHIHTSCLGPLVPLIWISGDASSWFQSQSGFCLIRFFAEVNVTYMPWNPPLVLHIANFLMENQLRIQKLRRGGPSNMKYKPLSMAAIFFFAYFLQAGGGAWPPCPPLPGSATVNIVGWPLTTITQRHYLPMHSPSQEVL